LPKDRGGSLEKSLLGAGANMELIARCHKLFEGYRPNQASSTQGGGFRTFVSHVFELSTGEEADLESQIKEFRRGLKKSDQDG
jgi:hypothetical protein